MAEQVEPVTRRVALKIIKAGMDTKEVIARFEAERQALAMMDHPNIARVFDAGATDKGRPFFVMELVKGIPITKFCDEREFTTRQRLELFADVCSAINHAHQKGVIHRDIKPSNVMVTLNGDRPVVKVIDFGIAKATQGRLTDRTLFTRFEQFVGTPAYMSPEQSALGGLDLDTRSDIYALGILLYELLTGKPPFDAKSLLSAGYEEMRRIIREVEPAKPSARLSTVAGDERTALARSRHIAPEKLSRMVEPDLDWIVMKAIEKDRTRRYETANGLALDIERFLADEPVSAGPPSAAYKFSKFVRRNRVALRVAAAITVVLVTATMLSASPASFALSFSVVAAVLVAATVLSTRQAIRATRAEKQAEKTAADEKLAREDAEAVSKFLIDVFQSADPARDGPAITVVETLDQAAKKLDSELTIQAGRRAKLHGALGRTYHALGQYENAVLQLEKSRTGLRRELGPRHRETLNAMRDIALAQQQAGQWSEALQRLEEVYGLYCESLGDTDSDTLWAAQYLAYAYAGVGVGRYSKALEMREDVFEKCRTHLGREHPQSLYAMNDLAISYAFDGREDQARQLLEKTVALSRKVNGRRHPETLVSMGNLSFVMHRKGCQWDDTINLLKDAWELQVAVLGQEHPTAIWALVNYAYVCVEAARFDEAMPLIRKLSERPPLDSIKVVVIEAWLDLGNEHAATCKRTLERASVTKELLIAHRAAKGYCLRPSSDSRMLEAALTLATRTVKDGGNDSALPWYQMGLGMAEYRHGCYSAADLTLTAAECGAEQMRADPSVIPRIQVTSRLFRAMSLFQQGKRNEARELTATVEAQMTPLPDAAQPFVQKTHPDDLICWLAYKEAKALLASKP